jgi:hypothetical protein
VNTLRYALADGSEETLDNYLIYSGLVIHGLTGFCLTLALNHQHKFRSTSTHHTHDTHDTRHTTHATRHTTHDTHTTHTP